MENFLVAAFYKFVSLPDYCALQAPFSTHAEARDLRGTLLLAAEGLNGTLSGRPEALRSFLSFLRSDPRLKDLEHKESCAFSLPFKKLKIRVKKEIVTLGVTSVDVEKRTGTYIRATEWNALITEPGTLLIDTRNDYEVAFGRFKGAVQPETRTFRSFPAWVEAHRPCLEGKKLALYCTGGIRCEKASSYLLQKGFSEVFQLQGGILKYFEEVPVSETLWQGTCFVFDERISVDHSLLPQWGKKIPEEVAPFLPREFRYQTQRSL